MFLFACLNHRQVLASLKSSTSKNTVWQSVRNIDIWLQYNPMWFGYLVTLHTIGFCTYIVLGDRKACNS